MADAEPRRPVTEPRVFAGWKAALAAALLGGLVGAGVMSLWTGQIVRGYILDNPKIIPEAMDRLRADETARVVRARRAALETPFAGAWAGARDGDVVLVEFFDYACGFCRKSNPDVERLIREDKRLKVVWREWPVLGPDSETAAEVSLAAARQGRFRDFHDRMFALGRPDESGVIERAQQSAGVAPQAVAAMRGSAAAREELARNYDLARAINATGTPTFVVGDQVLQGAVGYAALKEAIAAARARS